MFKLLQMNNKSYFNLTKSNRGFWYEFNIYKIVLWPCGLWPFEKNTVIHIFFYLIATISQIFIIVLVFEEIYKTCGSPADMLDYYAFFVGFFLSLAKVICIRFNFIRIYNNCVSAWKDWENFRDINIIQIMKDSAKTAKKFYYIQMIAAYCIVCLYVANPFILPRDDASNLPIQTVCSFRNLTDWKYVSVYAVQSISLLYLAFGLIGVDVFFFGIVMHLCAQLKILQIEFNTVGQSAWHPGCLKPMASLARKHYRLMTLANDIKITFSVILLLQFIISTFLVTSQSATFLIALKINNKFLAYKCIQSFPILFLEIFLYCYAGELLYHEFGRINTSIYNSYWYLLSPKLRQYYLVLTMTVANKTFELTAGQMLRVDMSLFIYFVKTMFSFFSLIVLMFDKHIEQ